MARVPTPDALLRKPSQLFANDLRGISVRLRRLGTVGIFPFQLTDNHLFTCALSISHFLSLRNPLLPESRRNDKTLFLSKDLL